MHSDEISIEDVVELCVPPISMADAERDLTDGQDIDLTEFADFATSEAGTPGGIGVAVDSLQAVSEDIETFAQTGAAPGDLELHAEALQEVVQILHRLAAAEIDSRDTPLYDSPDTATPEDEDGDSAGADSSEETQIPAEHLLPVTVDRISGSGNIIAEPVDSGPNHIHLQNGTLGQTVVAYHPTGNFASKTSPNKPRALPYSTKDDAQYQHGADDHVPLVEGQHLQVADASKEDGFVSLDGFDLQAIKVTDDITDGATILVEITDVKTNTAEARVEEQSVRSTTSSSSDTVTKFKSSSKRRTKRKSSGIPKITGGPAGRKNDLLSGKKL
jgi:predicted RNA-binding protein with TRAM domain